ncbi:zinc finger protein 436-like [Rhineura floridana]|uniref:zinc finger protein 436-like n=1 Tax=Rhineura floridana TaxID=261503 RepID=UPI002AC856A9|nr:zinc finger protein 436-like [Rhineura floridana]
MMSARPAKPSPLCGGGEAAAVSPNQSPVSLEDVAVYFTEEEWALLDPEERVLHNKVMEEICGTLSYLDGDESEAKNKREVCGKVVWLRDRSEKSKEQRMKTEAEEKRQTKSSAFQTSDYHITAVPEKKDERTKRSQYFAYWKSLSFKRKCKAHC